MEKNWIKLLTTTNPIEAEITKQMLEAHQIHAVVMNKQDSSYRFGQVELYVHESVVETAKALISDQNQEDDETLKL